MKPSRLHLWLLRHLPDRERIRNNRWLRWLGPSLLHPRVWHFSRRGVAVGVAIGVFFGLLIPIAQIPFAAGAAVLLRANVPIAVGSTLVTNPITFAPIYVAAHRLGASLLGESPDAALPELPGVQQAAPSPAEHGWWAAVWSRLLAVGKPLLLGLTLFAVAAGVLVYGAIMLLWRFKVVMDWNRRKVRRAAAESKQRRG